MKVLDIAEVSFNWDDLNNLTYHPRPEARRSGGLHVSDVLKYIALKLNMFKDADREDGMPLRILLGLGFEEQAARLYRGMKWQPGELELDRVYMSPDGLSFLPGLGYCVEEFKYTGKSMRVKGGRADELKDIRSEWMWMQQGMAYINGYRRRVNRASAANDTEMNLARFHICWKFGVYGEYPQTERYRRYLVKFTDAELKGNWDMILKHKDEAWEWKQRG